MRTFLALTPEGHDALAIEDWRLRHWPATGRDVPVQNLHVTLCFLGDVDERRLEHLVLALDESIDRSVALDVTFDEPGFEPRYGVTWLATAEPPLALMSLGKRVRSLANRAGIRVDKRPFKPHITLARRVVTPPPAPLSRPLINARFERIDLYESILDPGGVRYRELASWPSRSL